MFLNVCVYYRFHFILVIYVIVIFFCSCFVYIYIFIDISGGFEAKRIRHGCNQWQQKRIHRVSFCFAIYVKSYIWHRILTMSFIFFGSAQPGDSVAVCEQGAETDERLFGSTWSNSSHDQTLSEILTNATRW